MQDYQAENTKYIAPKLGYAQPKLTFCKLCISLKCYISHENLIDQPFILVHAICHQKGLIPVF